MKTTWFDWFVTSCRTYNLKVTLNEWFCFLRKFSWQFLFTLRVFVRNLLRETRNRNILKAIEKPWEVINWWVKTTWFDWFVTSCRTYNLKVTLNEWFFFLRKFSWQFLFTLRFFCQKSAERKSPKKYSEGHRKAMRSYKLMGENYLISLICD